MGDKAVFVFSVEHKRPGGKSYSFLLQLLVVLDEYTNPWDAIIRERIKMVLIRDGILPNTPDLFYISQLDRNPFLNEMMLMSQNKVLEHLKKEGYRVITL
jgi:hypothetical protein